MQYQVVAKELTRICTSADAFLGDSKFKIIGVDYGEGTGLEKSRYHTGSRLAVCIQSESIMMDK